MNLDVWARSVPAGLSMEYLTATYQNQDGEENHHFPPSIV